MEFELTRDLSKNFKEVNKAYPDWCCEIALMQRDWFNWDENKKLLPVFQ
jgi:hypothetical protein